MSEGKKTMDANKLTDLILCEPFTLKGINRVLDLGLGNRMTKAYVIKNDVLISTFMATSQSEGSTKAKTTINSGYTTSSLRLKQLQEDYDRIDNQFKSSALAYAVLTLTGVVGNGKSVETYLRLYRNGALTENGDYDCVIIDLERTTTHVNCGKKYECPNENSALWLFCTTLLEQVMNYIEKNQNNCNKIATTFLNNPIYRKTSQAQREVFMELEKIKSDSGGKAFDGVFSKVLKLLDSNEKSCNDLDTAKNDIKELLEILVLLMYCNSPQRMQYILVDNIEQYIKLTEIKRIQILDNDIRELYGLLRECNNNICARIARTNCTPYDFERSPVKIIFAIRRTSKRILGLDALTGDEFKAKTYYDLTGHVQIFDVWDKKKYYIWNEGPNSLGLKNEYDKKSEDIVKILDWMMQDRPNDRLGASYQKLIAALMSQGLRRNAKAQADTAIKIYEYLTEMTYTISFQTFEKLCSTLSATRYLLRKALMECQLKRMIAPREGTRWPEMNIGFVTNAKTTKKVTISGENCTLVMQNVNYFDKNHITMAWRILACLIRHYGRHSESLHESYPVEVFDAVPIVELMREVLISPHEDVYKVDISKKPLLHFARTLYSLGNMAFRETEGAPFAIVMLKEPIDDDEQFAKRLVNLWWENYSHSHESMNKKEYTVRVTEAGYCFVFDWLASFSYAAALSCYTLPPLVLIKEPVIIKLVIDTVWRWAKDIGDSFFTETNNFIKQNNGCSENKLKKFGLQYEIEGKEKQVSFVMRLKELHTEYLKLYASHIQNVGVEILGSEEKRDDILAYINEYISRYNYFGTLTNRTSMVEENKVCF